MFEIKMHVILALFCLIFLLIVLCDRKLECPGGEARSGVKGCLQNPDRISLIFVFLKNVALGIVSLSCGSFVDGGQKIR